MMPASVRITTMPLGLLAGMVTLAIFAATATAARPPAASLSFKAMDVAGEVHSLAAQPATGLVFISTECPISNQYVPELNRIAAASAEVGVRVFAVVSDPTVTRQAAAEFAAEYQLQFPLLFDSSGILARHFEPTHVPEAFVLDRAGEVVYRGRIDNRWVDVGRPRAHITQHDFREALRAVAEGKAPTESRTTPIGCPFEVPPASIKPEAVTYTRDIAPILQAHCVTCHRPGEVAPFPLTSYQDAAKRAGWLSEITATRRMPPWKPAPNFGHFQNEMRLAESEIGLLAAWAEAGAPEGDPADLPPLPDFPQGWQLGEPDLILEMAEDFAIPADGRDIFQHFVLPLDLPHDKMVKAVEFRPGNRRVVHHALFYLDESGRARQLDAEDPQYGYSSFGGPNFNPSGTLGGWAPGLLEGPAPQGVARRLPQKADLVMQIHYHPSGKPETDRSQLGIYFTDEPIEKLITSRMLIQTKLAIPPGEKRFRVTAEMQLPQGVELLGIFPHMHMLGREMKVTARTPNGQTEPLIWITDWNWNWQNNYRYLEPLALPKGTQVELEAFYDNSADNPANPNSPPKEVRWGHQTTDEMCICFFEILVPNPAKK